MQYSSLDVVIQNWNQIKIEPETDRLTRHWRRMLWSSVSNKTDIDSNEMQSLVLAVSHWSPFAVAPSDRWTETVQVDCAW